MEKISIEELLQFIEKSDGILIYNSDNKEYYEITDICFSNAAHRHLMCIDVGNGSLELKMAFKREETIWH